MSEFKTIKFSNNWNRKLDNIIFTTIRKANHYIDLNDKVAIVLNDKLYKWAQVICIAEGLFSQVSEFTICTDTGYEIMPALKIFENMGITKFPVDTPIKIIVLRSIENPGKENLKRFDVSAGEQQKINL